jgi:hypothetical protein
VHNRKMLPLSQKRVGIWIVLALATICAYAAWIRTGSPAGVEDGSLATALLNAPRTLLSESDIYNASLCGIVTNEDGESLFFLPSLRKLTHALIPQPFWMNGCFIIA